MKQKIAKLIALVLSCWMLGGCGVVDGLLARIAPASSRDDTPGLMVQRIDVTMHPADSEFERHYQTQENLTAALTLLREMVTTDLPEEEPRLGDGQTYYTITATYAGGKQQNYYILGYRFLKVGDEPWCEISFDNAMGFTQFIREHQSDDGSYIPPATEPETIPMDTVPQSA